MTASFRTSQVVSAADPHKPHVVLVGLPGAGKSTVGKLLGDRLKRTFLDFDMEIERRQGMPISQVFGELGEQGFRELEKKLTAELQDLGNMVVAPGGGWITNPETVALIHPPAVLVYLRLRPETALRRLATAVGTRPLLNRPDPLAEMNKLFESRKAAFQRAELEVSAEIHTPEQVADEIASSLRGRALI